MAEAATDEKIQIYWDAMSSLSEPDTTVTWSDLMMCYQIIGIWIEKGKLLYDLEQNGTLDSILEKV